MLTELAGAAEIIKVGIEAINGGWAIVLAQVAMSLKLKVMWDAKLHDVPSRVAPTIDNIVRCVGPQIITVHALGSLRMLSWAKMAAERASEASGNPCQIFGVTLPTSTDPADFMALNFDCSNMPKGITPNEQIAYKSAELAFLANVANLDGVVAPASAIPTIRKTLPALRTIVPGVRPEWALVGDDDQSQVVTHQEAFAVGADYVVIGRPIAEAHRISLAPKEAFERIVREAEEALEGHNQDRSG